MIRKKGINKTERPDEDLGGLSQCAAFEVTSEEAGSPLENALNPDAQKWVAATPGEQIIRLTFESRRTFRRSSLVLEETANTEDNCSIGTRPVSRNGGKLCGNSSISAPGTATETELQSPRASAWSC
jgi:hypothetical protein